MRIISENAYLTDKELVTKYKKLAAKADARLRRIEAKIGQAKFKGIQHFAYAKAKRSIANLIGLSEDKPRFNRSIKNLSRGQKEAMLGHVQQFIASETSTLSGYNMHWENLTTNYNQNHNTTLSVAEYRELMESEKYQQMMEEYSSDEAFEAFIDEFNDGVSVNDAINLAMINKRLRTLAKESSEIVDKAANEAENVINEQYSKIGDINSNQAKQSASELLIQFKNTPDYEKLKFIDTLDEKSRLLLANELVKGLKK